MSDENILLVGGPKSGDIICVIAGLEEVRVVDKESNLGSLRYIRRQWISNHGQRITVFVLDGLDDAEADKAFKKIHRKDGIDQMSG